jgi:hypothetical protein
MKKLDLLNAVTDVCHKHTESWEVDHIGSDLAYLMAAIAKGTFCEWEEERPLVKLLRTHFHASHPVWKYISIIQEFSSRFHQGIMVMQEPPPADTPAEGRMLQLFCVVRVKVLVPESENQADAILQASKQVWPDLYHAFSSEHGRKVNGSVETEFAEEIAHALVDEPQGDPDKSSFDWSFWYKPGVGSKPERIKPNSSFFNTGSL